MIPCFRCGRQLHSPDSSNADYVISDDAKVSEPALVFIALKETPDTLSKKENGEPVFEEEYEHVEMGSPEEAVGAFKVTTDVVIRTIQRTAVVCPDCYKPTDAVIWGVHKSIKEATK